MAQEVPVLPFFRENSPGQEPLLGETGSFGCSALLVLKVLSHGTTSSLADSVGTHREDLGMSRRIQGCLGGFGDVWEDSGMSGWMLVWEMEAGAAPWMQGSADRATAN